MIYSTHIDCDEEESYNLIFIKESPVAEKGYRFVVRYGF